MKKILIVSIVLLFGFCSVASAKIIYLKNGGKLEGEIVKENENKITIQSNTGTIIIERNEIDKIEEIKDVVETDKETAKIEVDPDRKSKMIYYLANTQYIYKNMAATYVELSVVYSYCYENAEFLGWDVVADPENPVAVLATAKFKTSGVPADILSAPDNKISPGTKEKMNQAVPLLLVTWRINDLIDLKITPYNFYAQDAIIVYKEMTDGIRKLAE